MRIQLIIILLLSACKPEPSEPLQSAERSALGERIDDLIKAGAVGLQHVVEIPADPIDTRSERCAKVCRNETGRDCHDYFEVCRECLRENPATKAKPAQAIGEMCGGCFSANSAFRTRFGCLYHSSFQSFSGAPARKTVPCTISCSE